MKSRAQMTCHTVIVTSRVAGAERDVKLWSYRGGEITRFDDASSPVFTNDGQYLLYIESRKSIEVFCLRTMQGTYRWFVQCTSSLQFKVR